MTDPGRAEKNVVQRILGFLVVWLIIFAVLAAVVGAVALSILLVRLLPDWLAILAMVAMAAFFVTLILALDA